MQRTGISPLEGTKSSICKGCAKRTEGGRPLTFAVVGGRGEGEGITSSLNEQPPWRSFITVVAFNVERNDCTQSSENGSQAADPSPHPCPRTAVRTGRAVMSCFSQRESCRATAGISSVLLLCDFIFPSCKITALTYVRVVFPAVQVNVYKCRATIMQPVCKCVRCLVTSRHTVAFSAVSHRHRFTALSLLFVLLCFLGRSRL